jgi:hypothetical protein
MKDKLTLWIVGLALEKNKQRLLAGFSISIGLIGAWISANLPEWAQWANHPELIGLVLVAAVHYIVNVLASGPLGVHAARLQSILNEMAESVGLTKPPLLVDGKTLGVTEEFADALKDKVAKAITKK